MYNKIVYVWKSLELQDELTSLYWKQENDSGEWFWNPEESWQLWVPLADS